MERIVIHGENKSPSVLLDADKGILEIIGRSTPENAEEFYNLILFGIQHYLDSVSNTLDVIIDLEYFNTATAKQLVLLFKLLEGKKGSVKWIYEEGDDDMKEAGEDYSEMFKDVKFIIEEKPE